MTTKEINAAIESSSDFFQDRYLDYLNNFITAQGFADHYGISLKDAVMQITIGMKIHSHRND